MGLSNTTRAIHFNRISIIKPIVLSTGSILDHARPKDIIWGSGVIRKEV
jgi:predicted NAD-dependent protein-ADP-ribosyltransferase YbiA (DUF1768 family)